MIKKDLVISLGGSLFLKGNIDINFLKEFKQVILSHKNYRFVIVTGGGKFAREYIRALRETGKSEYLQSMAGISVTRMNARFLAYFFGRDTEGIPHDMKQVKNMLAKDNLVFTGALRYKPKNTSDGTAANIAAYLGCDFVNLTLAPGLCDKNPARYDSAKLIPEITYEKLDKMMSKIIYKPGQHFVIDQAATKIIHKHKVKTYILGKSMKNFSNFLNNKKFIGTKIES